MKIKDPRITEENQEQKQEEAKKTRDKKNPEIAKTLIFFAYFLFFYSCTVIVNEGCEQQ